MTIERNARLGGEDPATPATRPVAVVAAPTLREELRTEEGLEVCRIVSDRVVLEFTRVVPEPETEAEGSMLTALHRGDVVVVLRDRGRRPTEEDR